MDDSVICAIAIRLLEVLSYLHSQRPPIIHRDIKPANIVVDRQPDEGNGEQVDLSLVDFGGVTSAVSSQSFGSTLVGTFGYMAPEQVARCTQKGNGTAVCFIRLFCVPLHVCSFAEFRQFRVTSTRSAPHCSTSLLAKSHQPSLKTGCGSTFPPPCPSSCRPA